MHHHARLYVHWAEMEDDGKVAYHQNTVDTYILENQRGLGTSCMLEEEAAISLDEELPVQ